MELLSAPAQKKPSFLIPFLLIISLLGNAIFAYQTLLLKQQLAQVIQAQRPTPSPQSSPSPEQEIATTSSNLKIYTDDTYKLSFNYPKDWQVNPVNNAIEITKNSWKIRLDFKTEFIKDQCGGSGPVNHANNSLYHQLTVLGRSASRTTLEKGNYWAGGDQPEPYPQPILFKRLSDELTTGWPNPDTDTNYVYKFCYEDMAKPLSLQITYYSAEFTLEKIQSLSVDQAMLTEMDQIIESLKLIPTV